MIVDCHTHWGMVWEQRDGGDPSKWLAVLDKHVVDKAFLMCHGAIYRMDLCATDNDRVASNAAQAPDRMIPIGTAWPQMEQAGLDEAKRCLTTLGMKGLKFHPWVQGFSTADATFAKMCALAGDIKAPVFFHDGTPCYCLSEQIGGLARRFPATTFVLGHSGLHWNWRSALEAARRPNVWVCLCGPHMRAMETFCSRVDPERLLWGSDFGFSFTDILEYRLPLIQRARIPDALREKILGANPCRLMGVGQYRKRLNDGGDP